MRTQVDHNGFTPPPAHPLGRERRTAAFAELLATLGLAIGTVVAATVVTAGIARASVADGVIGNEGSLFAISLLLGLIFIGFSGLSILPGGRSKRH